MNWLLKVKYLHCGELLKASGILERLDEVPVHFSRLLSSRISLFRDSLADRASSGTETNLSILG